MKRSAIIATVLLTCSIALGVITSDGTLTTLSASLANIGGSTTSAVADGDIASGDGTRSVFYDASAGDLTLSGSGSQFLGIAGNTGAPSFAFSGDEDTGWWNNGGGEIRGSCNGTQYYSFGPNSLTSDVIITANGSVRVNDDDQYRFGTSDDGYMQGETTTLSDGTATTVLTVNSVSSGNANAGLRIDYTIEVEDGTDTQTETGTVLVCFAVNNAGTPATPGISEVASVQAISSGTLTSTWTATTGGAVQLNADTSLTTPTTLLVRWVVTSTSIQTNSLTVP